MAAKPAAEVSPVYGALRAEEIPPNAARTMEALRELGYDSYASVLDLIDNSVDADARVVNVTISQIDKGIRITIADDGCGMDEETLREALRVGSNAEHEPTDLGKFGLGLVTASIGLAKRVDVYTKNGGGAVHGYFDLDEIIRENRFLQWVGSANGAPELEGIALTGTVVVLSSIDRIDNRNTTQFANLLRKRIGQAFRRFIKAGRITFTVNGSLAQAIDPLMLDHQDTQIILEDAIEVDGAMVEVRVVELPDHGMAANKELGIVPAKAGFYIVRNNREIAEAQTFDFFTRHPDRAHFRAELSFDGAADAILHTDVKKASITPSQGFLDKLLQLTSGLIRESMRASKRRTQAAKGTADHSIAEAAIPRRATLIPKPKTLVEVRHSRGGKGTHPKGPGEKQRQPHTTELRTPVGLRVVFKEANHGEAPFYSVDQEGKTLIITYNRDHPFWREVEEHADAAKVVALIDYLTFALANTELLVPEQAQVVKATMNSTLVGVLT